MANEQIIANLIVRLSAQTAELTSGLKRAETEVSTFRSGITSTVRSIGVGLAGMFGAFAAFSSIRQAAAEAREFGKAMSEVSTLLPKEADMKPLVDGAKEAAKSFGGSPREQAKAYYQIISAGATDAAQATAILTAANKLAVGGVTSVGIAADGLTTILNAYGIEASRSEEVTDAMFVAMRAGKTTIGELSSAIGKVAPIAAQTGVALDDLLAAVAALTTGGIETRIAVNGIRAVLAAIAKPSTEAADLAAQLGLNFSAAGLKAKGFAGFLAEVKEKTGGSTESLAKLFGGVESLVPIMSLAGNAGKDYAAILGDMATKAGQTEEAFAKMSEDISFKLDQLRAAFTVLAINSGERLLKAILPAVEAIVKHFDSIVKGVQLLSAVIVSRLVTAIVLYNIQLAQSIIQTLRATAALSGYSAAALLAAVRIRAVGVATSVAAGALRLLGGPIGAIITGLTLAAAAWTLFGQKAKEAGDSAIDQIHKMVEEFGKIPAPHQAILDAIQNETAAIEAQNVRLVEMREELNQNTSAAEAMMLAMGDVGAVNNLVDIERQLDANAAKLKKLAAERIALEKKVREAGEAEAAETKPPPVAITPPEVLAARHKANLKISQAAMAEELAVLEDSYKQGLIDTEAYYDRRRAILTEKIREEVALLKKEQGGAKPERKEEIRAEIFALESAGRTEVIKVTREQAEVYKALWEAIGEGDLAGFVAKNNLLMTDMENQFADGLVSIRDYYAQRRTLSTEMAGIEIEDLQRRYDAENDIVKQEGLLNQIRAAQAKQRLDQLKITQDETVAIRDQARAQAELSSLFAGMQQRSAVGAGPEQQAQFQKELADMDAQQAAEIAKIQTTSEQKIKIGEEFYSKQEALDEAYRLHKQEKDKLIVDQDKRLYLARLALAEEAAAGLEGAFGQLYAASGQKMKGFFILEKAAAIARAIINMQEGVTKALAQGGAWGSVLAGVVRAQGMAAIAAITAQTIQGMFRGGPVTSGSGARDDVPAMLTRGEYVQPEPTVRYYGAEVMEAIRRRIIPRDILRGFGFFPVARPQFAFATGGAVDTTARGRGALSLDVAVSIEDRRIAAEMTREIEDTVVRVFKRYTR